MDSVMKLLSIYGEILDWSLQCFRLPGGIVQFSEGRMYMEAVLWRYCIVCKHE
jgi:hypothetical protein